jgi:hypothetical protein
MNGYGASEAEFESEGFESEGFGESGEYAEANRRRLPRTASGRGLAPRPPTQLSRNYVTYAALRTATDKIGAQLKMNGDAIAAVGTRLNTTAAQLRKEFEDRKKDSDNIRNDLNQRVSLLALLPLLMPAPTYTIPPNTQIGVPDPTGATPNTFTGTSGLAIQPPPASIANALLPLLLIGGLGTSGSSGTSGGLDNTTLLITALVLANPH